MKYLNWLKKIDGAFDHYDEHSRSSVYGIGISEYFFVAIVMFVLTNLLFKKDMKMDKESSISEKKSGISAQTEIQSDTSTIIIPIKRCTR